MDALDCYNEVLAFEEGTTPPDPEEESRARAFVSPRYETAKDSLGTLPYDKSFK